MNTKFKKVRHLLIYKILKTFFSRIFLVIQFFFTLLIYKLKPINNRHITLTPLYPIQIYKKINKNVINKSINIHVYQVVNIYIYILNAALVFLFYLIRNFSHILLFCNFNILFLKILMFYPIILIGDTISMSY